MSNILNGLLARVTDMDLRRALTQEVATLRNTKDFGLMFERHIPENVALYDHQVQRGLAVRRRDDGRKIWRVERVANDTASLIDEDGEKAAVPVDAGPMSKDRFKVYPFHDLHVPAIRLTAGYYRIRDAWAR